MTILDQLKALQKLQKPHLGWYFQPPFPQLDLLTEFARITGSVPLSLEWSLPEDVRAAFTVAQATGCGIGVTSQPYQGMGKQTLPASSWGDVFRADLSNFEVRLACLAPVKDLVTHVTFDVEQWHVSTDPKSIAAKYQALIDTMAKYLPRAQAIWYAKCETTLSSGSPTGWKSTDFCPLDFSGWNSCSLYFCEHTLNQQIFRRSGGLDGLSVPFVPMGGCYRRSGSSWVRFAAPGMPAENLWLTGLEINNQHPSVAGNPERFPLSRAPLAYLYHETATEVWLPDFVTYVMGAANQVLAKAA